MSSRSDSPSSSSRSSATPPPQVVETKKKKKREGKGKVNKRTTIDGSGKNEGANPNWDYAPPPGAVLIEEEEDLDAGDFDWDRINESEDLELWLIRVPASVKPKYLDGLKVDIPSPSTSSRIGELTRKHATFDIWSIGQGDDAPVGGEEMKGISCLLPRKSKKGKLYPAPKKIARHILLSAQEVKPTPDPNINSSTLYKNPPRQSYPKEVLKHRFLPYGAYTKKDIEEKPDASKMVVDEMEGPTPGQPRSSPKKKQSKKGKEDAVINAEAEPEVVEKKSKGKKRKGELSEAGDTPATKKPKKAKAT